MFSLTQSMSKIMFSLTQSMIIFSLSHCQRLCSHSPSHCQRCDALTQSLSKMTISLTQSLSKMMTVSAAARLTPRPPAIVLSWKRKVSSPPLKSSIWRHHSPFLANQHNLHPNTWRSISTNNKGPNKKLSYSYHQKHIFLSFNMMYHYVQE